MGEIFTQGVSPTFLNLKNQLSTMYGASEVADLQSVDQQRVGIYVNQAYRECYSPIEGKRPTWAKTHFGITLPAPLSINVVGVAEGDTVLETDPAELVDLTSSVNYEGSFITVGGVWHTIARIVGFTVAEPDTSFIYLVEPVSGTTGDASTTLYHSSCRMDREVIDIDMVPEILGLGPLSPLQSPEMASRVRSRYSHDFMPGRHWGKLPSIRNNSENMEIDRPMFYFIDTSALTVPNTSDTDEGLQNMDEMAVRPRFNVYPIPDKEYTVKGTANILPHEMTADEDKARLPGNVVWDILFPIAMSKLALTDPRYNGDNKEAIQRSAEEARARLKTFTNAQKHRNIRIVKRTGY